MTNIPRAQKQPLPHIPKRANKSNQGSRKKLINQPILLLKNATTVVDPVILLLIATLKEVVKKRKPHGNKRGRNLR